MRTIRTSIIIALTAAFLASTGDRLPPPGASGAARSASAAPTALPEFALFGWVSPPAGFADSTRYAEMAAAGLNLALPALDDTGGLADGAVQLDLAAQNGLRVLVWDARFEKMVEPGIDVDSLFEAITADYRDHPALAGYYLGDEPRRDTFPLLGRAHGNLRTIDAAHPGWNNLFGRSAFQSPAELEAHIRDYADAVRPAVLCNSQYDFLRTGDQGLFFENVTRLGVLAREFAVPFWAIVQLVEHGSFRALTDGELRWQVSHLLAYGTHGVGYFTYWTPPPDTVWNWQPAVIDFNGQRTVWFDVLADFNPYVRAVGETLAGLAWITTQHAGSVPPGAQGFVADDWVSAVEGRAALGQFAGALGERYVLVANSDSLSAQSIAVTLPGADSVEWLTRAGGAWAPAPATPAPGGLRASLPLESGGLTLLRIHGAVGDAGASGTSPGLDLAPNPARGSCRFSISAALSGATLEIIDAGGRRVWARSLPPGRSVVQWNGETHRGGHAAGGLYFARVRDDRGTAVRRLAWLGAR